MESSDFTGRRHIEIQFNWLKVKQMQKISFSKTTINSLITNQPFYSDINSKCHAEVLSLKNHITFFIQEGFEYGSLLTSKTALFSYKYVGRYSLETDTGIIWDDEDLNIKWPLNCVDKIFSSVKDRILQKLSDFNQGKV